MGVDVVGVVGTGFVVTEIVMKVDDVCVGVGVDGCVVPFLNEGIHCSAWRICACS